MNAPHPRAIHDDRFVAVAERCNIGARQSPRPVTEPRVRVQGSAATLAGDLAHCVAVHLQGSDGCAVHVTEEALHDAAAE